MTDDRSSAHPSASSSRDADSRPASETSPVRPSITIVTSLADAADVSPLEMPPLNETVDVDALDSLFAGRDETYEYEGDPDPEHDHDFERAHGHSWSAIEFRYAGHDVRVGTDSAVTISRSETADHGIDDWPHVSPVDVPSDYELTTRLVLAVADRTDRKPSRVRSELERAVDLDALSRLNRRRPNGIPRSGGTVRFSSLGLDVVVASDGTIAVGSTLARVKRTGGNVLITGAVPDALVDAASTKLFGESSADRRHCVTLLDRDVDVVDRRLPGTKTTVDVVTHATTVRSTAVTPASAPAPSNVGVGADDDEDDGDAETGRDPADTMNVTTVTGDLEAVREATESVLTGCAADDPDLDPSALRLCVDSLRPVLDGADHHDSGHGRRHDVDAAIAFLEPLCETVRAVSALAHYVLPIDRSSPSVRAIEPLFDATVELRVDTTPQQRWHLHESGYTTDWFALRGSQ